MNSSLVEEKPLLGKVAVVAGATRGAGRGIAVELGAAGATVYCTGRSTRTQPSPMNRLETIEETAELVSAAGGVGIALRVDHTIVSEVETLFERVRRDHGRCDLLVNDVWGGEKLIEWGKAFWELSIEGAARLLEQCICSHIITSRFAVSLMLEAGQESSGFILEITDGDDLRYRGHLLYDLVKTSVIRLAQAMHHDLRARGYVAMSACALTPGYLRSEEMLEHKGLTEANWREDVDPDFQESETPHFIGRAVAALAADPDVSRFSGQALSSWQLAQVYGFHDIDGRQPNWGGYFSKKYGSQIQ